jgi:hypothetical protein
MTIRQNIIYSLAITTIALLGALWISVPVFAEHTTFSQKILPLNCVFEVINVGTQELRYLTPAECGQVVSTPPTNSTGNSGTSSAATAQQSTQFNTDRTVFFVSNGTPNTNTNNGVTQNSGSQLPWQPLATIASQGKNGDGSSSAATTAKLGLNTVAVTSVAVGALLVVVAAVILL